ncbi:MAG: MOSC domain-containing protein [Gemmatimonadaceae bacterium]
MSDSLAQPVDNNQTGRLASINTSLGGVPKMRVTAAQVSRFGLQNDSQNNKKLHGGPERAVCVYSLERIRALQSEGHPIGIGTAGENLTLEGIDWGLVVPGTKARIGQAVLLEIASFTSPCKTIKNSFREGKFARISEKLHPGWSRVYARVIKEGEIRVGDTVEIANPWA